MAQPLLDQTEFDAIVLGTGLTEAIVAGALARSGRTVLHLDWNAFYGSNWAARNFKEVWEWCQSSNEGTLEEDPNQHLSVNFDKNHQNNYKDIEYDIYARDPPEPQLIEPSPSSDEVPINLILNEPQDTPFTTDSLAETSEPQPIETSDPRPTTPITPITPTAIITLDLSGLSSDPPTQTPTAAAITSTIASHLQTFFTEPTIHDLAAIAYESRLIQLSLPPTSSATVDLAPYIARIQTLSGLLRDSRHYNLDLAAKVLFCRGLLVETLITSGVSRYLEFKGVEKSFIFDGEEETFDKVPISKEDIFTNKSISLVDKRKLMKFLTFALEYENSQEAYEGYEAKPFAEFLKDKYRIDGKLLRAVLYSIALNGVADEDANTMDGLARTSRFLKSLGRFGNYAFLYPLYGGGSEIAQAFCRICAVYGGIYMLNHRIRELLVSKETGEFVGLVDTNGQTLKSKWLITAPDYVPNEWVAGKEGRWHWISRAIVIIDSSAYGQGDGGEVTQTVFPPRTVDGNRYPVTMLQLNHGSQACPSGQFVLYFNTKSDGGRTAKQELLNAVRKVVRLPDEAVSESGTRRAPLFTLFYKQCVRTADSLVEPVPGLRSTLPANVLPCGDPNAQIDYEEAMLEARSWFLKCCPGEEEGFLPVPEINPEEEE
ncbi:GDP dissociation inhibitor-domain-containing protein [Endogone sp. FLAS-F59071]|nr:GDP dissociation inhibitor-domain-containing protein [Endogone sp. FLAS-F59071]|eukprot:RUS20819.1 GDP dissociation inhibitor-domain-containing protein [Endogone sp. FLAS-F59071]